MDSEILYALFGIVVFIFIIIFTLSGSSLNQVQSKDEKRVQIIDEYKKQLKSALEPLKNDKRVMMAKKSELLKKFSNELSRNIFFDGDEIREIISDLSRE